PPEKLLRAMLLQVFYSIRSELALMERLEYDLLFRWFVGIGIDDAAWDHFAAPRCVNRRTVCVKPSPFVHAYNAMAEFTALAFPAVDAAQGYANKPRRKRQRVSKAQAELLLAGGPDGLGLSCGAPWSSRLRSSLSASIS